MFFRISLSFINKIKWDKFILFYVTEELNPYKKSLIIDQSCRVIKILYFGW